MFRRKLQNFFMDAIDKVLLKNSQVRQSIATTWQEIKGLQELLVEENNKFLQTLLEIDGKIGVIDKMPALSSYRLSDSVMEAMNTIIDSVDKASNWDEIMGEKLLMEGPLWLNEGISRQLPLSERLATVKFYCVDPGYRRRLHLIKLLHWKYQVATTRAATLAIIEKLAEIAGTPESGSEKTTGVIPQPAHPESQEEILMQLFWGEDFIVLGKDLVGRNLSRDEYLEPELTQFILLNLKKDAVFFDVGAHFGYYSRLASQILISPNQIHAFEPTPSTFDLLKRNCQHLSGINLNKVAIWARTEEIMFTELGEVFSAFNTAVSPRLTEMHLKETKPSHRKVTAFSLDDYVANTGAVCNFVKIDAEGAEPKILKGMQGLLTGPRPIVTLEVGDINPLSSGASRKLVDTMIGFGYDVFEFSDGRVRRHELREAYEYDNLFFLPAPA